MNVCIDNVTFNQIQLGLEQVRMDANHRKDLPIPVNGVVRAVAGNAAFGLGALLVPTEAYGTRTHKVIWQQMNLTTPTDVGSYGKTGNLTCDVPVGDSLIDRATEFEITHEKGSHPIFIDEAKYRGKPFQLENDLVKLIGERIVSLENQANQDALDFLYANRGVNEHANPDYVKISGQTTYFGNGLIGDPNNIGYLLDMVDLNDLGSVQLIDGGALHLPIWEANKNRADDDKRSQSEKFMDLTEGRFTGYTRDLRGTGKFFREKPEIDNPKGFWVLENGTVSFLAKHYYPALVNPNVLQSREALFESIGINDFAQRFGEGGAYHDVSKMKINYAIPSFNLTQQYIDPQTGAITTAPVYIDVEHDIDCDRSSGRGPRLRTHKIQLFLRYGFFQAPTDRRKENTGIYLFLEDCEFTPQGFCVENPCDAIASLGIKMDATADRIEFEAQPVFEFAMPGTDEVISGKAIKKQTVSVYRELNGIKYGELIASYDHAQLQTANTLSGLRPDSKYWVKAEATFEMGADIEDCVKTSSACITTKGAESLCGAIDVDFDGSTAGELGASITLQGQNLNLGASLSEWMLSLTDADGTLHNLGTGTAIGDFPIDISALNVASGEATVKGYFTVGDCTITINHKVLVTDDTVAVASSNEFSGLVVGDAENLDILGNDQFGCAAADVEVQIVTAPTKGAITEADDLATINGSGGITYTPSEAGEDSFSYRIRCTGDTDWSNTVEVTLTNVED